MTGFAGGPLAAGRDFFASPPAEVGRVVMAGSDVRAGQRLSPLPVKLALAAACVLVSAAVIGWTVLHLKPGEKPTTPEVIGVIAPLAVAILAAAGAFRKRYVGYVGDAGFALFSTRGTRDEAVAQAARYADVADVQVTQKARDKGWVTWEARFLGRDGQTLVRLAGNLKVIGGRPLMTPPYGVASKAHDAWERTRTPAPSR